ncbi:MAG: SDR family oxidoreductase [Proteobacteria bacterium]|nr:SDR family oxidoreductase [Pseudomonadota bacterium]
MAAKKGPKSEVAAHDVGGASLAGKSALVTGAGRGIGRAIARRLLELGARVSLVDVDEAAVRDAVAEYGGDTIAIRADVTEEGAVAGAVSTSVDTFGGLDIAVNNAAISTATAAPIARLSLSYWRRVLDTNLTGPMLVSKYAAPHLARRNGAIVNLASTRALQSEPNSEAYATSKGGLVALTHALAISLGPAVRVNCISPGWIDTSEWEIRGQRKMPDLSPQDHQQHPAGRVGRAEDVADLCAWLVSDAATFITGQNLIVDGGMTRKMIYQE